MRFIKLAIIPVVLATVFLSCTKKQIKKDETLKQESQQEKTLTTKTEVTEMEEAFGEENNLNKKQISSLETVYFDFDKYELTPKARETLSKNAKIIMENNLNIIVEGHCDERGTNQYNLSLGQKRANAVKEYYIRLGVNPSKIATISYGEEMPVCFQQTEECWALNRRAETKVTE